MEQAVGQFPGHDVSGMIRGRVGRKGKGTIFARLMLRNSPSAYEYRDTAGNRFSDADA
jgi:hypothetical protein